MRGLGLDVVIVSYQCRDLLRGCLTVLGEPGRVVVVDNASTDGTTDLVRAEFPWAEVVSLPENRGFAAATNIGIRMTEAPYVLALNPDTEVTPAALEALVAVIEAHPE